MSKIWKPSIVIAVTLAARVAAAQSPPPPAPGGAFESLSPGNQKIALAIFDSEQRAAPIATKPLSLDQIAQEKQGGKGWGVVFKDMKSQGLVQDKNLGQAVSQMSRGRGGANAARTEITTASGKTVMVGGHGSSDNAFPGRRVFRPEDARSLAETSPAVSHGLDGASAARDGAGSHGGARGK